MTAKKFNEELRNLCQEAMADNQMDIFQILGSLTAAQLTVDRTAIQMSQHHHAQEMATKITIQPATILPKLPK